MSYRRSFNKVISVPYSGTAYKTVTFRVGDSSHTETISVDYSGTVSENVTVNVDIDTDPFDGSIVECNQTVGLLTGSVVATECAQVESISKRATQVGETIIQGFFSTVKSEISTQITELTVRLDALLIHLRELAQNCLGKQKQMEKDYNRICARYLNIFGDLNKELENRIYELDKPVFAFRKMNDETTSRALGGDLSTTVAVAGSETGRLETLISVSMAKKRAQDAIGMADDFLCRQKRTDLILRRSSIGEARSGAYYAPVCYMETRNVNETIDKNLYMPEILSRLRGNAMTEYMSRYNWQLSEEDVELVTAHFNSELENQYADSKAREKRVRDYITELFNANIQK